MKKARIFEKLRNFRKKTLLRRQDKEKTEASWDIGGLFSVAYKLLGGRIGSILPLFEDLGAHLQRAGLKTSFRAYVCLTVFSTVMVALAAFACIPCVLVFVFHLPVFSAFLFGLGGSLFAAAFSILGFYIYPVYRADKFRRELEDELAFATGYMSILASAGVPPEKIFYSLANLPVPLAISIEAKNVVRDVKLFGSDIISALERASKRSPSKLFREMIEGFISTIHSGSSLAEYLRERSKQHMRLKRINLRKFSDTLSILSEFYVALLVTGPLLFVIMLAVMAMLGGSSLGILGPDLLLKIITYIGIPVGSIIFLVVLDTISPKW
jgi:flagellar protein FlaJ